MSVRYAVPLVALVITAACGGRTGSGPVDEDSTAGALDALITSPNGDTGVLAGTRIELEAEFALGELAVAPGAVSWTSSLQGGLGEGNPLAGVALERGVHTITVSGSVGGSTASDRVTISVGDIAVRILSPDRGDRERLGDGVDFVGSAVVSAGGSLFTLVSGTPATATERAASFTWRSSLDGALGTSDVLASFASLRAGTHTVTLTVADDLAGGTGAAGTALVELTILPPNSAPSVAITAPACPATLEAGQTLAFTGSVSDPDAADVGLTGKWTDSVSGAVARGNAFTFPATAATGKHQVVFSATDAQGETSKATCDLFVVPVGGSVADLFPPAPELNDSLPAGDSDVRFIGNAGSQTLVGTDGGLAIYDAALALVLTPAGADYYTGDALGVAGGDVPVSFVVVSGARAVVGTSAGLALCSFGSGQLSGCVEVVPAEANAAAVTGNLETAGVLVAATDAGLHVQAYALGTPAAAQGHTFTDGGSNLPSNEVLDVVADGDTLYVATAEGLCVAADAVAAIASPETLCAEVIDSDDSIFPSDRVTSLALAGNVLWVGTADGLVLYDLSSGAMVALDEDNGLIDGNVNDVVVDTDGIVWVATDSGLSRLDPATYGFTNFAGADWGLPGSDFVSAIFIDAAGDKWLATEAGVVRYTGA